VCKARAAEVTSMRYNSIAKERPAPGHCGWHGSAIHGRVTPGCSNAAICSDELLLPAGEL